MSDDTKTTSRRPSKRDQLARLRAFTEARASQRPGDVIGLAPGMTARWLDLADGPGRVAELRALFASMGFERDPALSVVGVAQAEVWTAPAEAEEVLLAARIRRNRAKAEARARTREAAERDALIEDLAARMSERRDN